MPVVLLSVFQWLDEHGGGTKHMIFCNELSSSLVMQAINFRCLSMNELILVVFVILISSFMHL